MAIPANVRKRVLKLPKVEEKSHFGQADFRIENKIFVCFNRDESVVTVKLTAFLQANLLKAFPEIYSPAPGRWGESGWTDIDLERIDLKTLNALLLEAWRVVAPKSLVTKYARE